MRYCALSRMKNGTAAPKIRREDNFVIAMPSSLLEESVTISKAMMTPCSAPPAASPKMRPGERGLSLKTGSRTAATRKAAAAGMPNLAARYPLLPKGVTNRYAAVLSSASSRETMAGTKQNMAGESMAKKISISA